MTTMNDIPSIPMNKYQTPLTPELLAKYPDEVVEELFDVIANIEYVKRLISPTRKRAKDLPRDEKGRIIVDLANPHILEDMDYFRQPALHFLKHHCYTFLQPDARKESPYKKFWREEKRRCRDGYVRESDGEWIPGMLYWFLNYNPMVINQIQEGSTKAIRDGEDKFPLMWEGIYLRGHYLWQAREHGKHAIELARRGCGKSYYLSGIMTHNLILGEDSQSRKRVTTVLTAYEKDYLSPEKDGTMSKFVPSLNFIRANTAFPRLLLKNAPGDMTWQMGYEDEFKIQRGSFNLVMGVSAKDNPDKLRGKRGWILFEEMGCHLKGTEVLMYDCSCKKVEEIKVGDLLMGRDGTPRKVEECFSGTDTMYKITLSNGDWHVVNSHHPVYYKKRNWSKKEVIEETSTAPELMSKKSLSGYYIPKANIEFPYKEVFLDPYLLGLWLGDGDSGSFAIANEDKEVLDWLLEHYNGHLIDLKQSETCKVFYVPASDASYNYFKVYNLFKNKHVPNDYIYNSREVAVQVIAGFIDTDGNYSEKNHSRCFEITQRYDRKHILDAVKFMATNLGLRCTMSKRIGSGKKPNVLHYRLKISGNIEIIPTKIARKQAHILTRKYKSRNDWNDYTFKVEEYGRGEYYGFTVNKDHLFVLKDSTITHNTFKGLLPLYDTTRHSVEEGDYTFACMYLVGTSSEKESDFSSAKTLLYSPDGYKIYSIENVYDRPKQGRPKFGYFFPAYVNRLGCYNKDGVSDVTKALLQVLYNRWQKKYSADPKSVLKAIAEDPITPAEAIIKVKAAYFPVTQINERILQLDADPNAYHDVYIGALALGADGKVTFKPTNDEPIRKWGVDNDTPGALEIYEMPEKDSKGEVFYGRYIIGHDPVDNDQAESSSLSSTFVLDLFTDSIVAEFTGRKAFADDNFEIVRLLCMFYNAKCLYESNKKGLYAYFARMNCTHLLAETPQYLRDQQLVKYSPFGSNKYGVNASAAINNYANERIKEWLIKPVPTIIKDENGEEVETELPNLFKIRNRALLDELVNFTPEVNVDRIRALGMAMLLREEKMILYQGDLSRAIQEDDADDLANDPFFRINYDDRFVFDDGNPDIM